jgi:phosphatidylglycerol lysyltransferase
MTQAEKTTSLSRMMKSAVLARPSTVDGTEIERDGRWRTALTVGIALVMLAAAVWFIQRELDQTSFAALVPSLKLIQPQAIILAISATVLSYLAISISDYLALTYTDKRLAFRQTAFASACAYAVSNTLGFSAITGNAVRYRLYSTWGLCTLDVAIIAVVTGFVMVMSGLTLSGLGLLLEAELFQPVFHIPTLVAQILGVVALASVICGLVYVTSGPETRLIRQVTVKRPTRRLVGLQWGTGLCDWMLSATVLYALLPSGLQLSLIAFIPIFVAAHYLGAMSGLPGGVGVFEAIILIILPSSLTSEVAAALIAYRAIYYLLPLVLAIITLAIRQAFRSRESLATGGAKATDFAEAIAPTLYSLMTFITGGVMLFSATTPQLAYYFGIVSQYLPAALIEVSHLFASAVGTLLLITAIGLRRRLRNAWVVAISLFVIGAIFTATKGGDPKGSGLMIVLALCLYVSRDAFYRKGHLSQARLSFGRLGAILAVAGFALWTGFYAFRNKAYTQELWWQFGLQDDASRFLRAAALVGAILLVFFIWRLIQPAPRPHQPDSTDDVLVKVKAAIAGADNPVSGSNLALIGDKAFLFSPSGQSFIMYGIKGRNWIAMGEPVGLESERKDLMWSFRQLADNWDAWPSFYAIRGENLTDFVDLGLTVQKIGELALVPIKGYTLEGPEKSRRRQVRNRAIRDGCSFEMLYPTIGSPEMARLAAISDQWMQDHQGKEKSFSLGFFDEAALDGRPVGVVRKDDEIIAFANLWETPDKSELSLDLMRYVDAGVNGLMDYLMTEIILWASAEGYDYFSLGLAPLSGIDGHRLAPLMSKIGRLIFKYGGRIYSFEGLRAYKQKFNPDWVPVYLAAPSQMAMPQALGNLALLSSGGVLGLIQRGG